MTTQFWIDVFACLKLFFQPATLIIFLRTFYDARFQWGKKKACLLLLLSGLYLLFTIFNHLLLQGIIMFASLFVVVYDYKGKKLYGFLKYQCLETLVILCMMAVSSLVMPYYFTDIDLNTDTIALTLSEELAYNIFVTIYFMVLFLVLHFKVHKQGVVIHRGKTEKTFNIVYIVVLLLIHGLRGSTERNNQVSMIILASFTLFASVLLPVFVYSRCIGEHYRQRTKIQEVYLQSELEHFRQYMHAQEETRRFRHDIRNNLLCMNEMVSSGDHDKLTQYLKDMVEITDSLSFKYVTGDILLDSILNSKAQIMEQQNIRFELDGVLAGGLSWKPMDICAVFANAVDNAVEACQKVNPENRHISMNIKSTPQFWLISIENSVAEAVDTKKLFQKNGGYTSKADSSRHGIGTYSMKQTVESYGAIMKAECTDQIFTLEIMIDKSK